MYHEFFGLKQAPFKITPDTRLFFPGGRRGEILDALVYAISSGEGITKVVGEVGSGKTMLCRMLEVRLPQDIEIVYLPNPSLTPEDILHAIALELGLQVDPAATRIHVMQALHHRLLEKHAANERVVVFVEEAQSMPLATLEEIRLLSNLETQRDKLLQIVLFGQPELDRNLNTRNIRQLKERITHSFHLPPLSTQDIQQYVRFRMNAVGYRGPDVFEPAAYAAIAKASMGLTRRVNILADKCLLAGFAENTHNIARRHAEKAIVDSELRARRSLSVPALATAAGVVLVIAAGGGWYGWQGAGGPREMALPSGAEQKQARRAGAAIEAAVASESEEVAITTDAAAATYEMSATPAPGTTAPPAAAVATAGLADVTAGTAGSDAPAASAAQTSASSQTKRSAAVAATSDVPASQVLGSAAASESASKEPLGEPHARPASPQKTPPAGDAARSEQPAQELASATESATPARSSEGGTELKLATAMQIATPAERSPEPTAPEASAPAEVSATSEKAEAMSVAPAAEPSAKSAPVSLLDARLDAAKTWLAHANQDHFTIQLLATNVDQHKSLEEFLRSWKRSTGLEKIYVYKAEIRGGLWFGVLYDEYQTYAEAAAALKELPEAVKRYKPFIRNVRDIADLG